MSDVDFEKWARRDEWSLKECVMLSLGVEPSDIISPRLKKSFDDIYETARRSIGASTLRARPVHTMGWRTLDGRGQSRSTVWIVSTPDFLAWARKKEYPIPQGLEEAVNRFHPEARSQADRSARLRARREELTAAGDPHPPQTIAEEEGISVRRVQQLMKDKPKANEAPPTRPPPKPWR